MRFSAVLFDVGNTLLDVPDDPHERALRAVSHIGSVSLKRYKSEIERARTEWLESGGAPHVADLAETWIGHSKRALDLAGFSGDCELAAQLIEKHFLADGWEVFSEAEGVLRELRRQGIPMGIVSNWPATLEATLRDAGLRGFFEAVVVSGVVGYAKPHPKIFRLALERLGVLPEQTLFVGDSLEDDVKGAQAVGMPSILIDRRRRHGEHRDRIETLRELLDFMA